jgi:HSP20 family protein
VRIFSGSARLAADGAHIAAVSCGSIRTLCAGTLVAPDISSYQLASAADATGGFMSEKKHSTLVPTRGTRDPFAMLRQMTSELDRAFEEWPSFRWPSFALFAPPEKVAWSPRIDVFERDNRLVTRVDLPGMKKEDVSVEVTDGHLTLSGARKRETEEKKESFYRSEREYGSFYRAVPLPEGVKLEDVKATFSDGVLEVSVPLPARPKMAVRKVRIEEPVRTSKSAA